MQENHGSTIAGTCFRVADIEETCIDLLDGTKEPFELGTFSLLDCASARPLIANVTAAMIVTATAIAMDELRT
jgi:hypothetical protein